VRPKVDPIAATPVAPVPAQPTRHEPSVTVEARVDEATARHFYRLYTKAFGDLANKAVARQLLHEHEFMEEMLDERVDKYLARDENGEPVAMCTLTRYLETVPWISPAYFSHHYPEYAARDAIYYLGFVLVDHEHRRAHLFMDLVTRVVRTLEVQRAMCAWDVCLYNNEVLGLADAISSLLTSLADIDVATIDTQTYYRAVLVSVGEGRGDGHPADGSKLPEMRGKPSA
jgi:hypothetical protein